MRPEDLQRRLLEILGLRVGREMAAYLLRRMKGCSRGDSGPIALIGSEARTGQAVRVVLSGAQIDLLREHPQEEPVQAYPAPEP